MDVKAKQRLTLPTPPRIAADVVSGRQSEWNVQLGCAVVSVERLPQAWTHPWGGLGGVHTITGREWVMIITDDLATAYELHCHWADYAIGSICYWDTTVAPPNLCRVLNMRVISNTKSVPAHYYVENVDYLFDRDWMVTHCGELFQRLGDPDGSGLMTLYRSPNPIKRRAAECVVERIKQVARILGVPYSEALWYKRKTGSTNNRKHYGKQDSNVCARPHY